MLVGPAADRVADPGTGGTATRVRAGAAAGAHGPVATGRPGSADHSDHEPGHRAASMPATASAATSCAAVTPDPQ